MIKIKQLIIAAIMTMSVGLLAVPATASAANIVCPAGSNSPICQPQTPVTTIVKKVINTMLFGLGIAAVLIIIIAAIRLVLSGGNASSVTGAKNAILYAVIGLIVAISAYAIVNFVISRF